MKRIVCVILVIVGLLFYTGCSKRRYYTYEELSNGLTKIEIVELEESGIITLLYTLDEQEKSSCVDFLTNIEIAEILPWSNPISMAGICIRLVYENSSNILISNYGVLRYQDGNIVLITWEYVVDGEKITEFIDLLIRV